VKHSMWIALVALTAVACNDDIVQPDALLGSWGGVDAGFTVTATGAALVLTCGAGEVDAPIRPDFEGRFVVQGETWYVGGAPPSGNAPPRTPSLFSGRVDGDRLTLTIAINAPAVDGVPRTYQLMRNATPEVLMCP
jgi:hypothetical protein